MELHLFKDLDTRLRIRGIMDTQEILFTPSSLLDLLSKVDELKEYPVGLTETFDGGLQLQIGNSFYSIEDKYASLDAEVDPEVVDAISDVNEETYSKLEEDGVELETIESGLIKEALKTLAIGGVVRLAKSYLQSDKA